MIRSDLICQQPASKLEAGAQAIRRQKSISLTSLLASGGLLLAILSLAINIAWVILVPPLRGPDETAHLMAVMEVRTLGRLPEIHYDFSKDPNGVPVPPYGDATVAAYAQEVGLPPGAYSVSYESMQPPLYYLAAGVLSLPFSPDPQTVLLISKLVAALLGAATVYFSWAAVRQLIPGEPLLAMLTAGSVALLPVFAYDNASANNDSALYTVCTALFYVWFRGLRDPKYDPYLLKAGALLGLGMLAKLTMVALMPAFGLAIVFRALDSNNNLRGALRHMLILGLTSAGACLVVAGWWLARNLIEYGDISGSSAALRWYSSHLTHANFSSLQRISDFCSATFMSFVGLFSWDAMVFPEPVYRVAEAIVLTCVLLSWVALISLARKRTIVPRDLKRGIAILGLASLCVLTEYIQFNASISYQPQARYLFVLLVPISLALLGGLYILVRDAKVKAARVLLAVPPCLLVLLNWMAISMLSLNQ